MKTATGFALALAAAVTVGGITVIKTQAASAAAPFGQHRAAVWSRVIEKLGLTEDQVDRIKAELRSEKDAITALLKRLHAAHAGATGEISKVGEGKRATLETEGRRGEVAFVTRLSMNLQKRSDRFVLHLQHEIVRSGSW